MTAAQNRQERPLSSFPASRPVRGGVLHAPTGAVVLPTVPPRVAMHQETRPVQASGHGRHGRPGRSRQVTAWVGVPRTGHGRLHGPGRGLHFPAFADPAEPSMVIIRLSRGGAKKRPFYHVVVADSRSSRDGRFIERLGFFNPIAVEGEERIRIDVERVSHWQSQGAQTSPAVRKLLKGAAAAAG